MNIRFKKGFTKSYKKLGQQEQTKVDGALAVFQKDPFQSILYNHELKGKLAGNRAISAGHDLRIIYSEEGDHAIVYLLKTGTHNQVY